MADLNKEIFVCIDCETTGLDAENDRIIEVAAVVFTLDEILDSFEALVNPEIPIPESSMKFHHISDEMVKGKPLLKDELPELLSLVGKHIIIGHGIGFDVEMIALAADRAGIPHTLRANRQIDTLRMARIYGESPVNSLDHLRQHFNIEAEGWHRAMSDVIVNVEVFKYLARFYKTTEQIFKVLSKPIYLKAMPLGRYKGRLLKDLPLDYIKSSLRRNFDQDLTYSLKTELNRRRKGNLFSQATNPFSQL